MSRPDYRGYNRSHREKLAKKEHEGNIARMQERVEAVTRRKRASITPTLIARRAGPPGSAYKYLYNAHKGLPKEHDLARNLGGAENLVQELGGESAPLAYLRRPPRPASVRSRVADVEELRKGGKVPLSTGLSVCLQTKIVSFCPLSPFSLLSFLLAFRPCEHASERPAHVMACSGHDACR